MAHDSRVAEFPPSITNERCRELMGPEAEDLTDEQIDALLRHADAMAHLLIDIFLTRRSTDLSNGAPQDLVTLRERV